MRGFRDSDRQRRGVPIIVGHDRIEPFAHAVRRDQQDEQQADGRQQVEPVDQRCCGVRSRFL